MKLSQNLLAWYGNRGTLFDFILSIIFSLSVYYFFSLIFLSIIIVKMVESTIAFFSIIAGFLFATFGLLLTFSPENNQNLVKLRKHPTYKRMLKRLINAPVQMIILIVLIFLYNVITYKNTIIDLIILFQIIFVLLISIRTFFFLFLIIKLDS